MNAWIIDVHLLHHNKNKFTRPSLFCRVVDLVSKTILSKDLKAEISGIFSMMFGDFDSAKTFAVRSSAVGM